MLLSGCKKNHNFYKLAYKKKIPGGKKMIKIYVKDLLEKLNEGEKETLLQKLRETSSSNRPSGRKKMKSKIEKDDFIIIEMEGKVFQIIYYNTVVSGTKSKADDLDLESFVVKQLLEKL